MRKTAPPATEPVYSERLHLSIGWWFGIVVMLLVLLLQVWLYLPIHPAITFAVPLVLLIVLLGSASLTRIAVDATQVTFGRKTLPGSQIASVEELDHRNTRLAAGVAGDPAAWTLVRPWVQTSVKVVCIGEQPPYVLLSSRHPERLSAAIVACATSATE